MMSQIDKHNFIIHSQIVNAFLIKYSELESKCRSIFLNALSKIEDFNSENKHIDILVRLKYLKANFIISFMNESIESVKLSKEKHIEYKVLTLKEMVNLGERYSISDFFNQDLPLIKTSSVSQTIKTANALKILINVRNALAHETFSLNLTGSKYEFSTVSKDLIKINLESDDYLSDLEITDELGISFIVILTGYVYISKLLDIIKDLGEESKHD